MFLCSDCRFLSCSDRHLTLCSVPSYLLGSCRLLSVHSIPFPLQIMVTMSCDNLLIHPIHTLSMFTVKTYVDRYTISAKSGVI